MFRYACARMGHYTRPIVISWVTTSGHRASRVAASVLINSAGWIVTAANVLTFIKELEASRDTARSGAKPRSGNGNGGVRSEWWGKADTTSQDQVRDFSVWWGEDRAILMDARIDQNGDAAVGRLEPAATTDFKEWPELRNAAESDEPGASLCKLGFPFHRIVPEYDEKTGNFTLPPGSVPLPFFPIEGIYCRTVEVTGEGQEQPKARFIETSSPSPDGHIGGPLFDVEGRIWGIQSHTAHYSLGFRPAPPGQPDGTGVDQFLNAGRAAHISAVQRLLDETGAEYRVSKLKSSIN